MQANTECAWRPRKYILYGEVRLVAYWGYYYCYFYIIILGRNRYYWCDVKSELFATNSAICYLLFATNIGQTNPRNMRRWIPCIVFLCLQASPGGECCDSSSRRSWTNSGPEQAIQVVLSSYVLLRNTLLVFKQNIGLGYTISRAQWV